MGWFFGIYYLIAGGLLAAASWEASRYLRVRRQALRDTVELCGLHMVSISRPGASLKLAADAGPVKVRIEDIRERKREFGIRVTVAFPGPPGFTGVRIRREAYKPPGAREVEIGDDLFDGTFYIEGPTRLLSVLLDAETRRLLVSVNAEGRLRISGGELQVETFDVHLANLLPLLLDLTRRFSEEVDVAPRLAENARQDPNAGVRLWNLLVLLRELPGQPGTVAAIRAACADPSLQVRLRAAMALGAEARDVLVELAETAEDDSCSAQAVSHLNRELGFERTRAILGHALRKRRHQTARACLEVIGTSGEAAAVDLLEKVLAVEKGELAAAAALALGATGSPAAEPALLLALRRDKADVQVAAATALGHAGSAAAVLPLKEADQKSPDDELRRAARQAIAQIQSRLPGASPGQLSLSGAEEGQLSLAQAEAGQLSLAADQAGQLSLPPEGSN
ncbi:MAG TPA: HEAT repeat domain-containing protein [Thermoanaerobaculia bacterium]|nr:HEAT repeat domain-containing protein [Thermoanaerobaculia bacterium]